MRFMKNNKSIFILTLLMTLGAFVYAQDKVTEAELEQFASAFLQVQNLEQLAQQEMVQTIEEKGLAVERFNEIQQIQQNPDQVLEAAPEEVELFESVSGELSEIQVKAQENMQVKIVEEGLTVPRYQELASAIQSSPELQQKVQEYLKG